MEIGKAMLWQDALKESFACGDRMRLKPDTGWLLSQGAKVLTMQAGFGLVEAAMSRKINSCNIMMKNVADLVIGALAYFLVGYRISFAEPRDENSVFGEFGDEVTDYAFWFFQWSFAATAATIDSGAIAERTNFFAYLVLSAVTTAFIYPVAAHWSWGGGWLYEMGFIDFAGSSVVHGLGGFGALAGALICGPRLGRFKDFKTFQSPLARMIFRERYSSLYYQRPVGDVEEACFLNLLPITNPVQCLFGTLLLWMGWYGFNAGSTAGLTSDLDLSAAKVCVTTTMAAAGGGMAGFLLSICGNFRNTGRAVVLVPDLCTGILGGLVGVTAGCAHFSPVSSLVVGFVTALSALWSAHCLETWHVDDVVGAIAVHGVAGLFGTVLVAFFSEPDCKFQDIPPGIFFGGDWHQVWVQFIGSVAICAWGFFATWLTLVIMSFVPHLHVRSARWDEIIGMDLAEHYYDDNFDYFEEKSRNGIMQSATTEPIKTFLHGADSPAKDQAFKQWNDLRVVAQNENEDASNIEPWVNVIAQSAETLKAFLRRLSQKQSKRMEKMELKIEALTSKVDMVLQASLYLAEQQDEQVRNNDKKGTCFQLATPAFSVSNGSHPSLDKELDQHLDDFVKTRVGQGFDLTRLKLELAKMIEKDKPAKETPIQANEHRMEAAIRIQKAFRGVMSRSKVRFKLQQKLTRVITSALEMDRNVSAMISHRGGVGRSYNQQSWRRRPKRKKGEDDRVTGEAAAVTC